eukprot:scaffold7684_cov119-Isochrysis_galbana.AAC.18
MRGRRSQRCVARQGETRGTSDVERESARLRPALLCGVAGALNVARCEAFGRGTSRSGSGLWSLGCKNAKMPPTTSIYHLFSHVITAFILSRGACVRAAVCVAWLE